MGFAAVSCPGGQKGSSWKMLFFHQALFSCKSQPPGGKGDGSWNVKLKLEGGKWRKQKEKEN